MEKLRKKDDLNSLKKENRLRKLNRVEPGEGTTEFHEIIKYPLKINALLWDRNSHGLFDYDSKNLTSSKHTLVGCSFLARDA